jgi:AcrR family transcriptional regulator
MRRKNTTAETLKEYIADALFRLMPTKSIDKITISEITDLANVGRATYFRYFSDKADVITFKLVRLWNRWAEEHNLREKNRFTVEQAKSFFDFNLSIRSFHKIIYEAKQQTSIYNAFSQVMMPQFGSDAAECYRNRFLSYGLFGLLDEWIRRGYRESPQEMAEMVALRILSGHSV